MAQGTVPLDPYFISLSTDRSNPSWKCLACDRVMKSFFRHSQTTKHLEMVALFEAHIATQNAILPGLQAGPPPLPIDEDNQLELLGDEESNNDTNSPEQPPSPISYLRALEIAEITQGSDSDNSDLEADVHKIAEAIWAMEQDADAEQDEQVDDAALEAHARAVPETSEWYPFKRKEMKENFGLHVSERTSPHGQPLFGLKVQTIVGNEFANPLVRPHLICLPELPQNEPVNRFSQSQKWREGFSKDLRVPMVVHRGRHWFIYEPVRSMTHNLVVPLFFFQQAGRTMAKCLPATLEHDADGTRISIAEEPPFDSNAFKTIEIKDFWKSAAEIILENGQSLASLDNLNAEEDRNGFRRFPIVNPWRTRANGLVIKHVPIILYSDDTSGNVSKKWNKHMSIFLTLAGLPPKMTNQEYHIHFLATSNCASALELLDEVVDDVNSEGFITYDYEAGTEVLVMVVALCHLGDGPMHAEISNTTNPANTLTPCRICDLRVITPKRDWALTRTRTNDLWTLAQMPRTKAAVETEAHKFGLRDPMLEFFIKKVQNAYKLQQDPEIVRQLCEGLTHQLGVHMFNPMLRLQGFDGHKDTPVETLHVVLLGITKYLFRDMMKSFGIIKPGTKRYRDLAGRWHACNVKGLHIAPIQPNTLIQFYQSLVGKDFRTILQIVPFVFFEYIPANKRHLWTALCLLSSFIFQNEISHMEDYLIQMEAFILIFYNRLIKISAQWVNKPKFHMLSHLKDSIKRFGPATLFMTEKFECYNGVLRAASVHSNRMSPGQDIANTFNNYQCMRAVLSGNTFFDKHLGARCSAGPRVQSLLKSVPELSKAMGLNLDAIQHAVILVGPQVKEPSVTPDFLTTEAPDAVWKEHLSITLVNKQIVEKDDFVKLNNSLAVGQVVQMWKPDRLPANRCLILLRATQLGGIDPFYGMRKITRTHQERWVKVTHIHCILNVQHNCNQDVCPVAEGSKKKVERQETSARISTVAHIANNDFILNSASHYSAEAHRAVANIIPQKLAPAEWLESLLQGLQIWQSAPVKPHKKQTVKSKGKAQAVDSSSGEDNFEAEEDMGLDADLEVDDGFLESFI
ncbi:hypothetical protein DFH28DRAFT_1185950 [Melampsora americana]|nr:hypothetical protein DFH28DRAFT_1185950 [Melampsora americana]